MKRKIYVQVPTWGWQRDDDGTRHEVLIEGASPYQGTHLEVHLRSFNRPVSGSQKIFKSDWVIIEGVTILEKHGDGSYTFNGIGNQDDFEVVLMIEETLGDLAQQTGIAEGTLLKAAQTGRLEARQSGKSTWLSTIAAVEFAVSEGKIRG